MYQCNKCGWETENKNDGKCVPQCGGLLLEVASEAQPPQAGSPSATGSARVSEPEAGDGSAGRSAQNSGFPALVERVKHARALSHECLMTYRKMELRDQENFALGQFDAFAAVLKWIRVAPENAHPAAGERALARNDKAQRLADKNQKYET